MAVNVFLGAEPSGEEETVKKEGGPHSRKIWRIMDHPMPESYCYN